MEKILYFYIYILLIKMFLIKTFLSNNKNQSQFFHVATSSSHTLPLPCLRPGVFMDVE